jgi:hypothetical protein
MTNAHSAAILTWAYAAGFGIPVAFVAPYLARNGTLPTFFGMFPMYGGPWSTRFGTRAFIVLLFLFLDATIAAAWAGWLVWQGSHTGAVISLALLPVEAVFWIGFALPIPWAIGIARVILLAMAWKSFD